MQRNPSFQIPIIGAFIILLLMVLRTVYEATWDATPWCERYLEVMGFYLLVLSIFLTLPKLACRWNCHGCKISAAFTFFLILTVEATSHTFGNPTEPLRFNPAELIGYAIVSLLAGFATRQLNTTISNLHRHRDLMASGLSEALWVVDCRLDTVEFGERFAVTFGYKPEDISNSMESWRALVHPEDTAKVLASFDQAASDPKRENWEELYRIRHADGHMLWVIDRCRFDRDEHGVARFAYGGLLDVTARIEAERKLVEINETLETRIAERTRALEDSNRELASFTYSITHDLKSPLAGIMGYADLLAGKRPCVNDPQSAEFVRHIIANADRMNGFIADLLAKSRLDSAADVIEPVALARIFDDLRTEFSPRLRITGGSLSFPDTSLHIAGNASLAHRVFQNIIVNALKYHRPEIPPQVRITCEKAGDFVSIAVSDNGLGIPAESLPHIFDYHYRVGAHSHLEGQGIGLFNVKKSVRLMEGTVEVTSEVGQGTTFIVRLPAATVAGIAG